MKVLDRLPGEKLKRRKMTMTISERTLREWRKQALIEHSSINRSDYLDRTSIRQESCERILRLTQELLDIKLMKNYNLHLEEKSNEDRT
jgi:hypothetical protein